MIFVKLRGKEHLKLLTVNPFCSRVFTVVFRHERPEVPTDDQTRASDIGYEIELNQFWKWHYISKNYFNIANILASTKSQV